MYYSPDMSTVTDAVISAVDALTSQGYNQSPPVVESLDTLDKDYIPLDQLSLAYGFRYV